ncbi:MAG: Fe-S cluster assembly sulfur transfer protein SufU [Gammaproteobacteria bacterium]
MSAATDLKSLYRSTVLDHSRNPRNFRRVENADASAEGHNPLCGDKVTVYVRFDGDDLVDVAFEGVGCAIALASASIMTEQVGHETLDAARQDAQAVLIDFEPGEHAPEALAGDMAALSGVRAYPSRIKCATLAWKTLLAALDGDRVVTTE